MNIESMTFLVAVALLAGLAGVMLARLPIRPKQPNADHSHLPASEGPIFLFDGENLVDCNPAGRALLARSTLRGGEWQRLVAFLSTYFKDIDARLAALAQSGVWAETAAAGNGKLMLLQAELAGGLTKIALLDPDVAEGPGIALAIAHRAIQDENDDLRRVISTAPILMWRESETGQVSWANDAYVLLAAQLQPNGGDVTWPFPRLFDQRAVQQSAERQRQSVTLTNGKTLWFDLVTQPTNAEGEGDQRLCYALPIDAAVAAEGTLRDFMQTLSKTFAQLPIGLAIFDKDRVLQMFNPALVELTQLPADFLARKPRMLAVLDAMRDKNLLPEPKDYHSWRQQIVEMERAAASGLFQENWPLPDGQTFRVTGRPHPNGGLALMIEDISGEMQRSRRYRSDLEISQSVLDQMAEAVVVFSQSGQLLWCNAAYSDLWSHDPAATLGEETIRSACDHWRGRSAPTHLWRELDEFIHTVGLRQSWSKDIRLTDGRAMTCAVTPIAAGATMIAFRPGEGANGTGLVPVPPATQGPSKKATAAR